MFKKYLSSKQWLSLCILTVGCIIQKMDIPNIQEKFGASELKEKVSEDPKHSEDQKTGYFTIGTGLSLIFVQVRIK